MNACLAPPALILALLSPGDLDALCRAALTSEAGRNGVAPAAYVFILALNGLLETPCYWAAGRMLGRASRTIALQVVILDLATHPIVSFGFPYGAETQGLSLLTMLVSAEAFAFTVEAGLLRLVWGYPWPLAILASTAANLVSWQAGAALYDAGLAALLPSGDPASTAF